MTKKSILTLTKKDFELQFFRAGGKGGQHQNKTSSACRIIHRESGAVGECREHRHQKQNKETAFERLVATDKFKKWHKLKCSAIMAGIYDIEKMAEMQVDEDMKHIKVQIKKNGKWVDEGLEGER